MTFEFKVLDKEELKELEEIIEKNYGVKFKFDSLVLKSSRDKIWLVSKDFSKINFDKIKANSIGLYFGRLKRNNKIHLSIEGTQLIGPNATKNIVEVDEENMRRFLQGLNVKPKKMINCEVNNFVVIKYKDDFLGSGILREDYVENLLPKTRRIYLEIRKI